MKKIIIITIIIISCVFAGKENRQKTAVAVSIPALGALSKEILKGTPIKVIEPFGNEISIDELDGIAKIYESQLDEISKEAAAVVDIRSIIPLDPLFVQLRHRNIKIVEIDCAVPLSPVIEAIGKIRNEDENVNPFVWLSLSNSIRMAEVLENDFSALFPKYAKKISANLIEFKKNANALRNNFVRRFLKIDNFNAVSFSGDFDYLLKDIDLFVIERFLPEYDWDEETVQKFENLLENQQIAIVISRWEALEPASEIMKKFGIKTAVLKTGFPAENSFENGFLEFWKENVSAILYSIDE